MALRNRLNSVRRWTRARVDAVRARPWLVSLILIASVATPGYYSLEQTQQQTCKNGNEQRAANEKLWNFIVDVSAADAQTPPTVEERAALEQIREWINDLYAPRDCDDLDREYEIPDPPPIIDGTS